MSETTDAARLLARGRTVTLADGATHEFRFPARALARIEVDYGSLEAFTEALKFKTFSTLAYAIHLTLGAPLEADRAQALGVPSAVDLIDTRRAHEYLTAIGDAFEEALPEENVRLRIVQDHQVGDDRYRANSVVTVPSDRARHLLTARVAVVEVEKAEGNSKPVPGESLGAGSSASLSSDGTSTPSASGI